MIQQLAALDTLRASASDAPAEVVQTQIDSALAAELRLDGVVGVPAADGRTSMESSVPSGPSVPPVPAALLALCLVLLVGIRRLGRSRVEAPARTRRAGPAVGPGDVAAGPGDVAAGPAGVDEAEPEADPDPDAWKRRIAPKPQESIVLPPHVVAMLQRLDARQQEGAMPVEATQGDEERAAASPPAVGGRGGVDYWIGR